MEEKIQRKYTRWEVNQDARLRMGQSIEAIPCRLHNVSFKGVEISLDRELEKEKPNKLRLCLSDGICCSIEGWVVWHKTSDGNNSYGLYFTRISDADKEKIYTYVTRSCPQQVRDRMLGSEDALAETAQSVPDRRDFERFSLRLPVVYSEASTLLKGEAETSDMSAAGIGLTTREPFARGTSLFLEFCLTEESQYIRLHASVVWSKEIQSDSYRIGVKLDQGHLMSLGRLLRARPAA